MKLKPLLLINAIVAVLFALGFVLVPNVLMAMYAVSLSSGAVVVARLFGAALFGFGLLTWLVRNAPASEALNAIVMALFVSDVIAFVIAFFAPITGAVNAMGWTTVVIYGLLAIGFGSHVFKKQAEVGSGGL